MATASHMMKDGSFADLAQGASGAELNKAFAGFGT
jgi:hypothetical protein